MKKIKDLLKKADAFLGRYINGTKGAIAIFLTLLMIPFVTIAGVLINAARINSAVAVFDEALCNASNSTLGTYDKFLKKRFGLLAIAQSDPSMEEVYSAEEFLSETFQFYMEQNLGALYHAYETTEISAAGVYPLADTDVLLSEVMEYGKYAIPTKLVIDGLSLDKLLSSLTNGLKNVTNVLNTLSSGLSAGDSLKTLQEDLNTLIEELVNYEAALAAYNLAYETFKQAVQNYNGAVDDRETQIENCETAVSNAKTKVNTCQSNLEKEAEKVQDILDEIKKLENEKDSKGNPVDNSKKIADLKKEHEEELKPYYDAETKLKNAEKELTTANSNLEKVKNDYSSILNEKRTAVSNAKTDYSAKIDALATQVSTTSAAAVTAKSSAIAAQKALESTAKNVMNTVVGFGQSSNTEKIEELEEKKKEAQAKGDTATVEDINKQITDLKDTNSDLSNVNKVGGATVSSKSDFLSTLDTFSTQDFEEAYGAIEQGLRDLKTRVDAYVIASGTNKMESAAGYYLAINSPCTSAEITDILDNLIENLTNSAGLALVKALIGFVKAFLKIGVTYDPLLKATVDPSLYGDIGGLPSKKDRTNDKYSLDSEFEETDRKKSDQYKEILGAYSSSGCITGSVSTLDSLIDSLITEMELLGGAMEGWTFTNFFSKIADAAKHAGNMIATLIKLMGCITEFIANAIYSKVLVAGYVAYNTANRTTYSGKALTGASFGLPSSTENEKNPENTGYVFSGAETEYIMIGSYSEEENQKGTFTFVYVIRVLINLIYVFSNAEVASIAASAGTAIPVVGAVIVYVLYGLAEPLIDSILLCNGGSVPIFKTRIYLTPSGIPDLISELTSLKLDEATKKSLYDSSVDVISKGTKDQNFEKDYETAKGTVDTAGKEQGKWEKSLCFNYTKTILLYLMFMNTETLLDRLSDVIQMECTYNEVKNKQGAGFNLDKSFTYIRASGKFTGTQFITVSDSDPSSSQRIVYRGY